MKRILLTGATGFLGSNLLNALVKSQKYEIAILKRSFSDTARIDHIIGKVKSYDIDCIDMKQPFEDCNGFDVVVHTATTYGHNDTLITTMVESNVLFPIELMELASSYNKSAIFINTDTFFNNEESSKLYSYLSDYTLTKSQFLNWGKLCARENLIKFINVKLFQMYGYNDGKNKFTSFVLESLSNSLNELKLTPGEQKRDFIYIEDVVSAYLLLIDQSDKLGSNFQEFELGNGGSVSIKVFVEEVARIFNSKTKLQFGALPYRENEIMDSTANLEDLCELGWSPKYSLKDGLSLVIKKIKEDN